MFIIQQYLNKNRAVVKIFQIKTETDQIVRVKFASVVITVIYDNGG